MKELLLNNFTVEVASLLANHREVLSKVVEASENLRKRVLDLAELVKSGQVPIGDLLCCLANRTKASALLTAFSGLHFDDVSWNLFEKRLDEAELNLSSLQALLSICKTASAQDAHILQVCFF